MAGTAHEVAEKALTESRAGDCVVIVDETSIVHLRWAANRLTANGLVKRRQVTVIAMTKNGGGVSTGAVSRSAGPGLDITELVRAAEHAAARNAPADDAAPLCVGDSARDEWAEPAMQTSPEVFGALAEDLGVVFARAGGERRLLYGYAEHRLRSTYLATSSGSRLRHVQPLSIVDLTERTTDGAMATWAGATGAEVTGVFNEGLMRSMDELLVERLGRAGRRIELPPGRYEVLLSPSCVADLMVHLYDAAGADDACDGRSPFGRAGGGTRVGERLTSQPLTLRGDPRATGLECAPFVIARAADGTTSVFDNGLPLRPTAWITDGTLTALVQSRRTARRTGLPVTPRIDNLILEGAPGGRSLSELVAATRRGLLLTSLWYIRDVDPGSLLLTGLTRDGVYLVENGEIVGSVNNFRFNESPVDLLGRVIEVGRGERTLPREWGDLFTRVAMPALRVGDFNLSSVSRAT